MVFPRISIITPSFNQGDYIGKCIKSVLAQDYPNIEYIIVDGCSTDQTVGIIKKYDNFISKWISEKDEGQSDAINKGIKYATGEIANWLNCDDYLEPGALHKIAEAYLENGRNCVIIGKCRWVNRKGKVLFTQIPNSVDEYSVASCGENWIPQPSGFFPRKTFLEIGKLSNDLHYAMDFDMYLKLVKKIPFYTIDHLIANALVHQGAKTISNREKMFAEVRISQFRNGYEGIVREGLIKDYERLLRYQKTISYVNKGLIGKTLKKLIR